MSAELRKYGVEDDIDITLYQLDGVKLEPGATFAAGDVTISKNGAAAINTTNLPVDIGSTYTLTLTATEQQAARLIIKISDQTATQIWLDTTITIETYGNASAQHAFDLGTASVPQTADNDVILQTLPTLTQFNLRTILSANYATSTNLAIIDNTVNLIKVTTDKFTFTIANEVDSNVVTNSDKTGYSGTATNMRGTDGANTVTPPTVSQILTTQMVESYAPDGVAPTLAQSLFITQANLQEFKYSGLTQTVKKLDGTSVAATYTLDNEDNPTSKTRAT